MSHNHAKPALVLFVLLALGLIQITCAQTILIDFGNASSFRGVTPPSPDHNNHHWNSVYNGAYYKNLVDINGNPTTINFGFSTATGTDSYNGPAGVTSAPITQAMIDATDIDNPSLGSLAANEAAMDFYVSSKFEIHNLDSAKTYNLTFFGSHKFSTDDTTIYSAYSNNTYTTQIDSTTLNVQTPASPWLHNRNTTATLSNLTPQQNNLYIQFKGTNGNEGYLNCLMLEEVLHIYPTNPSPQSGDSNTPLTTKLTWTKPQEYTPANYTLSIRPYNANWQDTDNTQTINPVNNLNQDSNPDTTESALPIPLDNATTYYWKVTSTRPDNNETIEGTTWSFTTQSGPPPKKKLLAHYMPWYKAKPYSSSWSWHWTMNHFNPPTTIASHYTPVFGPYDSNDPHVLASQALLMKFAGIDGMIADWYGIEDFWDYAFVRDATEAFIPFVKQAQLEFSICYEDQTVKHMLNNNHFANRDQAVAHGVTVMQWLQSHYFNDPAYLKINNRPTLLCFGPQFFTYAEWEILFASLNPQPHFFPLKYHNAPGTGEFDWPSPSAGTDGVETNLNAFFSRADSLDWPYYLAAAFPRFHDIYAETGSTSYGYIDDQNTQTFKTTLDKAFQSDATFIQLITWNDYGEGTIIEPTEEKGYTYLEIIQDYRKQHIDPNFAYTPATLRLPVRLWTLRQTYKNNPGKLSKLDTVETFLFADKLLEADTLMNQIDCNSDILGDFNSDCKVNLFDVNLISYLWLTDSATSNWNPDFDISEPKDNIINILDLLKLIDNWLTGTH